MRIVDRGAGPALVLIPGIQGRWEYIGPAVEALSSAFRVITFSLCDEPAVRSRVRRAREGSTTTSIRCAARSIGAGSIGRSSAASRSAASSRCVSPPRIRTGPRALVLASTPGPGWHLRRRHEIYARLPYLLGPLFLAETPWRLRREMAAAFPGRAARWRFAGSQLRTLMRAPLSLSRMACRARMIANARCGRRLRTHHRSRPLSSPASARSITSCRWTARPATCR